MTALTLVAALATIFAAGFGLTLLLQRSSRWLSALESLALSWLLGTGVISFALWICGFAFGGTALQFMVSGIAAALLTLGLMSTRRTDWLRPPRNMTRTDWLLSVIVLAEIALVFVVTTKHTLGWDGLLNWELKARYAFLGGGVLPRAYFADAGRAFSHADYPLGLPFTELWVYLCLREPNQLWSHMIAPLYFAAAAILVAAIVARLTSSRTVGFTAAALLPLIPQLTVGNGSASSGYADFPLAVIYLAACGYLAVSIMHDDQSAVRVAAACSALLPWFKREGVILWLVFALCYAAANWRKPRRFIALLPGFSLLLIWRVFVKVVHAQTAPDFALPSANAFYAHAVLVCTELFNELCALDTWSVLWLLLLVATVCLLIRRRDMTTKIMLIAIYLPVVAYSCTYLFSAWPDPRRHIETSLSRLLLQVVPFAAVAIARAVKISCDSAPSPHLATSGDDPLVAHHAV